MSYPLDEVIKKALEIIPKEHDHATTLIWWLLESITGLSKLQLLTTKPLISDQHYTTLVDYLHRHFQEHYPLQYLLKSVPFCGLTIHVEPPILIPRPETEEWVTAFIKHCRTHNNQSLKILDMCTGSGCIGLALAHALPHAQVYLVDISEQALSLAQKNGTFNNITNVTYIQSDLYSHLFDERFDAIVSNPPYLSKAEYAALDPVVKNWEDKNALLADDDGLACIQRIINGAHTHLVNHTKNDSSALAQLTLEIGSTQAQAVQSLCKNAGFATVNIHQDMYGKDRIIQCF